MLHALKPISNKRGGSCGDSEDFKQKKQNKNKIMTILICTIVYLASLFVMRWLCIKNNLTQTSNMVRCILPVYNTIVLIFALVVLLCGCVKEIKLAKKFFGKE